MAANRPRSHDRTRRRPSHPAAHGKRPTLRSTFTHPATTSRPIPSHAMRPQRGPHLPVPTTRPTPPTTANQHARPSPAILCSGTTRPWSIPRGTPAKNVSEKPYIHFPFSPSLFSPSEKKQAKTQVTSRTTQTTPAASAGQSTANRTPARSSTRRGRPTTRRPHPAQDRRRPCSVLSLVTNLPGPRLPRPGNRQLHFLLVSHHHHRRRLPRPKCRESNSVIRITTHRLQARSS